MNIQDMLNPQEPDSRKSRKEKAEAFPKRSPIQDKSTRTTDQTKKTTEKPNDNVSTGPSTTGKRTREYDPDKPIESIESSNE